MEVKEKFNNMRMASSVSGCNLLKFYICGAKLLVNAVPARLQETFKTKNVVSDI